jgi:hypothetical protein
MTIPLRVMVLDTWDEIPLSVPADTPVAEVKGRALELARVTRPSAGYLVKFRGAEVPEGPTTVAVAGLVPNAAVIVLSRRRNPAK